MASSFESVIRRIEWLEKRQAETDRRLAKLADALAQLALDLADARNRTGANRLVILFPDDAVDVATYTEAVPYDVGPPEVPYVPPRLVAASGTGRIWQTYDATAGELRAREYVRRWDPEAEPPAPVDDDATVAYWNINPDESIPVGTLYVICMEQGGMLIAASWHCLPAA